MNRLLNPGHRPDAPLFRVDHQVFTAADCERILAPWLTSPMIDQPASLRIAVCVQETGHWLAFCLFCRDRGISVLPIHPGTPRAAASNLARASHCTHLLYATSPKPEALEPLDSWPLNNSAPDGELIQMSSGTTGQPKTLRRPWQDIDRELTSYIAHFPEASGLTPVIACPVSHSYGLICGVLSALERGAVPRVITNLNPRSLLATLRDTPEHLLYASPTLIGLLVRLLPSGQRLHTVMLSGAPLAETVMTEVKARTQRLCQQYGCSEIGCIALTADASGPNHLGTALPHLEVNAGTPEAPGEILVQPHHHRAGAIATRDLGYLDQQGQLHFSARMDDTINVAGINVYPGDVESAVLRFPGIREAIAFKQSDALAGERVALAIVANEHLDTDQLRRWCRERLSPHQIPSVIHQMATIPTLPNGKISRRHLAQSVLKQTEVPA